MITAYWLLFISSFGAATLLPVSSELALLALLEQHYDPLNLWLIATVGNTLGAVVNWVLGRYLTHFAGRRWFPFEEHKLHRAQGWFQRYGLWSLLFAWLPLVGDALTFIAGVMRVHLVPFVLLVLMGKGARYGVLILMYDGVRSAVSQ